MARKDVRQHNSRRLATHRIALTSSWSDGRPPELPRRPRLPHALDTPVPRFSLFSSSARARAPSPRPSLFVGYKWISTVRFYFRLVHSRHTGRGRKREEWGGWGAPSPRASGCTIAFPTQSIHLDRQFRIIQLAGRHGLQSKRAPGGDPGSWRRIETHGNWIPSQQGPALADQVRLALGW